MLMLLRMSRIVSTTPTKGSQSLYLCWWYYLLMINNIMINNNSHSSFLGKKVTWDLSRDKTTAAGQTIQHWKSTRVRQHWRLIDTTTQQCNMQQRPTRTTHLFCLYQPWLPTHPLWSQLWPFRLSDMLLHSNLLLQFSLVVLPAVSTWQVTTISMTSLPRWANDNGSISYSYQCILL